VSPVPHSWLPACPFLTWRGGRTGEHEQYMLTHAAAWGSEYPASGRTLSAGLGLPSRVSRRDATQPLKWRTSWWRRASMGRRRSSSTLSRSWDGTSTSARPTVATRRAIRPRHLLMLVHCTLQALQLGGHAAARDGERRCRSLPGMRGQQSAWRGPVARFMMSAADADNWKRAHCARRRNPGPHGPGLVALRAAQACRRGDRTPGAGAAASRSLPAPRSADPGAC
jgi:hypothetical protein